MDLQSSVPHLRALCGLTEHTPFECVGQVGESRLALELCVRRGVRGRALDAVRHEIPAWGGGRLKEGGGGAARRFFTVEKAAPSLPRAIAARIMPQLREMAIEAAAFADRVLSGEERPADSPAQS